MKSLVRFCFVLPVLFIIILLIAQPVSASPAEPGWVTLTQPDGKSFQARQWGDEWDHGWETADGYTILLEPKTQVWVFATLDEIGNLIPSGIPVGASDLAPAAALSGLKPGLRPETTAKSIQYAQTMPATGTANILVIMANFKSTGTPPSADPTTYATSDYQTLLFNTKPTNATGPGSLKDYYQEASYNKLTLSSGPAGVKGWYVASKSHDYYGSNDAKGNDQHPAELVKEIVQLADADIDYSKYDNDNDGKVDIVVIIHQGTGEEAGSHTATDIWSHQWTLSGAGVGSISLDGKLVDNYLIVPELIDGQLSTIGVFAHELAHALGLRDLYKTTKPTDSIVGSWSLMDNGNWLSTTRAGDTPSHLDAWSKATLGWITPVEVKTSLDEQTIRPVEINAEAYQILKNPGGYDWITNTWFRSGEFFLVENRQKLGFDAALPSEGLLIWHINEGKGDNNDPNDRLAHVEKMTTYASCDNCFMEVAKTGDPDSNLNNKSNSGVNVTDIHESGDNVIVDLNPRQIVFVVDDTGSMGDDIASVRTSILSKIDSFQANPEAEHYSVVTFKDEVGTPQQTGKPDQIKTWINALSASGGGDCPEASLDALRAIPSFAPTSDAWLMTDASPHGSALDLANTIYQLVSNRIKIYPVILGWCTSASGSADSATGNGEEVTLSLQSDDLINSAAPFKQIAEQSGGRMFYVSAAEVADATNIILTEMDANSDLDQVSDLLAGDSKTYSVIVDEAMPVVNFLMTSDNSTSLTMTVVDPTGHTISAGEAGVTSYSTSRSRYFSVSSPKTGVWKASVIGTGSYTFSSSVKSNVLFSNLSPTRLELGKQYLLMGRLEGLSFTNVKFSLVSLDGKVEIPVTLSDNGTGGDVLAGDDIYSGYYSPTKGGKYYLKVTATSGSVAINRIDTTMLEIPNPTVYIPVVMRANPVPPTAPLYGTVASNNIPVSGMTLTLWYYNGSSSSSFATATTDSNGKYAFNSVPTLTSGQYIYVRWVNSGNSSYLSSWTCYSVSSNAQLPHGCSFDISNVVLSTPVHNSSVSLPYSFTWQRRSILSDSYEFDLNAFTSAGPYWWSAKLGYVSSYTLNALPNSSFSVGVPYGWYLWIYGPDGYGISYYYFSVTFLNTGSAVLDSRQSEMDDETRLIKEPPLFSVNQP
jgi:M6 family metalloprotease-like protein